MKRQARHRRKAGGNGVRLREYEYILAIAREKNMVRAARSLYVSQPALSKLLAGVEAELGVQLFERNGRMMTPTQAGRVYLSHAARIVRLNAQMERQFREQRVRQPVALAYPLIYSGLITGSVLPALHRAMPFAAISTHITPQRSILEGILQENWPLALGIVTDEHEELLAFEPIGQIEMALAVPRGHSLEGVAVPREDCTFPFVPPEALEDVPFLMPHAHSHSGQFAQRYFRAHALCPPVVLHASVTGPLFYSVAAGAGVAILPSIPACHMQVEPGAVVYLSIEPRSAQRPLGVMYRRDHVLTEGESALIDCMRACYEGGGAQA